MNPHDPTSPLDPEERAMAQRLARLGPHGEPSPTLDARVLAAAHAATTVPRARRARWPLGLGLAASVALAVGLAWQLRPLPGADPGLPAAAPAPAEVATRAPTAAAPAPASEAPAPPPPPAPPAPAPVAAQRAAAPVSAPARDVPPPEPELVFDASAPAEAMQKAQAAPVPASEADTPATDVPPATVASPQVRDAWLARIRELAASGRDDDARASLVEFQRRYPDFPLPDDLRALLPSHE